MWVLRRELFAREGWLELLRNQVLRPCANASLKMGLAEFILGSLSASICSELHHRYRFCIYCQLIIYPARLDC